MDEMICRDLREGDLEAVSRLIHDSFHRHIARDYRPEGITAFLEDTSPEGIAGRMKEGQLLVVAEGRKKGGDVGIAGVIAVRRGNHISLFFVDEEFKGRGVGRTLLREVTGRIRKALPDADSITVNSSPHAVGFYERMGFRPLGPPRYKLGMLVNPMVLRL
jgi:ribosomal protein S18 acetylase RimI-like enzyme